MTPLPKKRHSKSRKNIRRGAIKLMLPRLSLCANCGAAKLPHTECRKCGAYRNTAVSQ